MSNEDLVNKIERSLHMLIDNSTAAGRLEVMTKPLSELQLNMLKQGRTLFFFNSMMYRL